MVGSGWHYCSLRLLKRVGFRQNCQRSVAAVQTCRSPKVIMEQLVDSLSWSGLHIWTIISNVSATLVVVLQQCVHGYFVVFVKVELSAFYSKCA